MLGRFTSAKISNRLIIAITRSITLIRLVLNAVTRPTPGEMGSIRYESVSNCSQSSTTLEFDRKPGKPFAAIWDCSGSHIRQRALKSILHHAAQT